MPRKPSSRALVPVTPTTMHRFGSEEIANFAIYRMPDRHPSEPGPWQNEPDKLAWWDADAPIWWLGFN